MSTPIEHDFAGDSLPIQVEAEARADADRFYGEAPMPEWEESEESTRERRHGWAAIAAGAVLALVGGVGLALQPTAVATAEAKVAATSTSHASAPMLVTATMLPIAALGNPDDDIVDKAPEPTPVTAPTAPAPREATPAPLVGSPSLSITRVGAEWRIEANGASRLAAAQQLAQVTGSPLGGDVAQLAAARPLDLHWQGRLRDGAWAAVLGSTVSFASRCDTKRCQVYILEARAAGDTIAHEVPRAVIPLPTVDARELAAAALRQSASTDPRVAAHHD